MYLKIFLNKMSDTKDVEVIDISTDKSNKNSSSDNNATSTVNNGSNEKKIFVDKKRRPVYNLDDNIVKVIRADNDVHFKLLSNNKGVFVDIRRYNRGFPTQKGVRVYASVFRKVGELLKDDIISLIPNEDLSLDKLDKIISI
jgi:hypothetical protein